MSQEYRTAENAGGLSFSKNQEQESNIRDEIKEQSERLMDDAKERSRHFFSQQKGQVAQTVGDIADAMDVAVRELQEKEKGSAANYVDMAAVNLRRLSDSLHDRDVDQLAKQFRSFAQRQPGLLLGGSIVAGFALSRFLKSSSEQREHDELNEPSTTTDRYAMGQKGTSSPGERDEDLEPGEQPADQTWREGKDGPLNASELAH